MLEAGELGVLLWDERLDSIQSGPNAFPRSRTLPQPAGSLHPGGLKPVVANTPEPFVLLAPGSNLVPTCLQLLEQASTIAETWLGVFDTRSKRQSTHLPFEQRLLPLVAKAETLLRHGPDYSAEFQCRQGLLATCHGTSEEFLDGLTLACLCDSKAESSVQLSHNSLLGMSLGMHWYAYFKGGRVRVKCWQRWARSASCTAASTYGDAVQHARLLLRFCL